LTIAYINKNSAAAASVQLTGVTAGHLIVLLLHWDTVGGNATVSDGSSTFAYANTVSDGTHNLYSRLVYCLSSVASGTVTYTGTFPGGSGHQGMDVMEYSYSAGSIVLDNINLGVVGTGTTVASQNFSTTGTSEVVFGGTGVYTGGYANFSNPLIGGASADQSVTDYEQYYNGGALWSKIATVSSSNAAITIESGNNWTADAISFKESGGGGETIVLYKMTNSYTCKNINLNIHETFQLVKESLAWTGKSVNVHETIQLTKQVLQWVGKSVTISAGQIIQLLVMPLSWVGKGIFLKEVLHLTKMTMSWVGKQVTFFGEAIGGLMPIFRRRRRK
jgi:hypothetical protein